VRLQEKVARKIAWVSAEASSNGTLGGSIAEADFWELILTDRLRDHYRDMAMEIIDLVREETL
jgi:hypothetical protein